MKIQFLHHASFLLSSDVDDLRILTDPWFLGSSFVEGWDLMWPIDIDFLLANQPDYIWISHEHPDHFSIPTLKKFIEAKCHSIFLYQETIDKRVINWLEANQMKTCEIKSGTLMRLSDSTSFWVRSVGTGDSYCIVKMDNQVFVNTNDAILLPEDLNQLTRDISQFGDIDVLTTQFGIAGKVGNSEDVDLRQAESSDIRELVLQQIKSVNPKYFIPSASMKVFSRSDNFYMNSGQSSLSSLNEMINSRSSAAAVFLDSLDSFDLQTIPDSTPLIDKFDSILEQSTATPLNPKIDQSIDSQTIQVAIDEWWSRQRNTHSSLGLAALRFLPGGFRLKKLGARLVDTNQYVLISSPKGRTQKPFSNSDSPHIEVSSSVLLQSLKEDFGFMSLIISARFQSTLEAQKTLRTLAWIGSQRAAGQAINIKWLMKSATRGISFILKRRKTL